MAGPIPDQELKPLMDEADAALGLGGAPAEEPPIAEEVPPPEAPGGEGDGGGALDLAPLKEKLGVDDATAQGYYDAAQDIDATAGKEPAVLADMLDRDFSLLMKIEEAVARGKDAGMDMGALPPPEEASMAGGAMSEKPEGQEEKPAEGEEDDYFAKVKKAKGKAREDDLESDSDYGGAY